MAYPERIPPLKKKEAREFLERLRSFKLTKAQRDFWAVPSATRIKS